MTWTRPVSRGHYPPPPIGRSDPVFVCTSLFIVLACFRFAAAQDADRNGATTEATESWARVSEHFSFRRERFTYVRAERRDPMVPPGPSVTDDPVAGGIRLLGIMHHPRSQYSLVLVEVGLESGEDGGGASVREPMPAAVRLRIGDSVSGMRISEIHPDHVVVETASSEVVNRRVVGISRGERGRGT